MGSLYNLLKSIMTMPSLRSILFHALIAGAVMILPHQLHYPVLFLTLNCEYSFNSTRRIMCLDCDYSTITMYLVIKLCYKLLVILTSGGEL